MVAVVVCVDLIADVQQMALVSVRVPRFAKAESSAQPYLLSLALCLLSASPYRAKPFLTKHGIRAML